MVDAVAELNLFEVCFKSLELRVVFVAVIRFVYVFEQIAQLQIVFVVLIPEDVSAVESRFGEIVHEFFLLEGQFLESGHTVAEYLYVGEPVDSVVEVVVVFCHS